jgi:hypothetical protein
LSFAKLTLGPTGAALVFPEIAWRGAFDDYRRAMAGRFETSDVAHFLALLVVTGARLRRRVRHYNAALIYPNIFGVYVVESGEGKGLRCARPSPSCPAMAPCSASRPSRRRRGSPRP